MLVLQWVCLGGTQLACPCREKEMSGLTPSSAPWHLSVWFVSALRTAREGMCHRASVGPVPLWELSTIPRS